MGAELGSVAKLITKSAFRLITPIKISGPANVVIGVASVTVSLIGISSWTESVRSTLRLWVVVP